VGWVSLDTADNDPAFFWAYFVAALQSVHTEIGKPALSMLRSPQPPPAVWIVNSLINELADNETDFALVLDDYHEIDNQSIHESVSYLVEHLPPNMHLFIATRADPPLPLARLRARGQMTELRATDLRFTSGEAMELLNRMMHLGLSHSQVETLETRTEGWIAGLRMAALSIRTTNDVTAFIDTFGGGTRHVFDYLIEEVVDRQPPSIRDFLLHTSILDRLTGPLCNVITGRDDSQKILQKLEHENLFLVPLDDNNRWYRYHQLFSDLLRAQMISQKPNLMDELHSKASRWFESEGFTVEAVNHAMAAQDWERVKELIEPRVKTMIAQNRYATVAEWLSKIPSELIASHPWLCVLGAWASLFMRKYNDIQKFIQWAETIITEKRAESDKEPADWRHIRAYLLTLHAFLNLSSNDLTGTIELCHEALTYAPADDVLLFSTVMLNLGIAFTASGDLESGYTHFKEAATKAKETANYYYASAAVAHMADIEAQMGQLHRAAQTYRQAIRIAEEWGTGECAPVAGYAYVGLGEVLYEWNSLDEAASLLSKGLQLGEMSGESEVVEILERSLIALARLYHAQRKPGDAQEAINRAKQLAPPTVHLDYRPLQVSSAEVRIWLAEDTLDEAIKWTEDVENSLTIKEIPDYRSEVTYLTSVRVKIAGGETKGIPESLESLQQAMHEKKRTHGVIEVLTLKALALQVQGRLDEALVALRSALSLAKSEGYVRTFVDEGEPMLRLLKNAAAKGIELDYVTKLLATFGARTQLEKPTSGASLAEELTQREKEVLRLVAAGLSNRDSAELLVVTEGTIKKHLNNVFGKLGVRSRTQAVARAKELDLL
jgi:LuxR family maltose regulon positive regulatory protein